MYELYKRYKMDRQKANEVLKSLQNDGTLGLFPFHVAGSYRRGKTEGLHDVDIVIVNPLSGAKKEQITVLGEQVDFFYCTPDELGPMYMTWTGSMEFNIMCRAKAKRMGLKFTQYGITDLGSGERKDDNTEEGILELLNIDKKYLDPEKRSTPL